MTKQTHFFQQTLHIPTAGRGTIEITPNIRAMVKASGITTGLCHVFIHHTSASLIISENADPEVRVDLETFMAKLAPDGDPMFIHASEGDDDMPAHAGRGRGVRGLRSLPQQSLRAGVALRLRQHLPDTHCRRRILPKRGL